MNLSAGNVRSVTYGSGGSGDPAIRDVVHGTLLPNSMLGGSPIALREAAASRVAHVSAATKTAFLLIVIPLRPSNVTYSVRGQD